MKILVIVAHPDDEILGMGGTLLKHRNAGDEIFIHILTDGHSSRLSDKEPNKQLNPLVQQRIKAAKLVAQKLNAEDFLIDKFEDQMLDTYPIIKIVKAIESFAKSIVPDIVYTHFGGDLNKDHRVTFSAALTAFRPVDSNSPTQLFCAEIPSSTEWGIFGFNPNYYVDISKFLDEKIKLLSYYKNEMRNFPHPRSIEGIRNLNINRGVQISSNAAEAFYLIRKIWK